MKQRAVRLFRGLRSSLSQRSVDLNPTHAPVGMLDVERITRVAPPVSTVTHRPYSTAFVASATHKV